MSHNDESNIEIGQEIRQSLIGLDPDSRYAIRVRSVDGLGNKSEWSEAMEFETAPGDGGRPNTPVNVVADWSNRDINITWSPVFTREDGAIVDVNNYEFVVVRDITEGVFTLRRYPVYTTSFTYTREQQESDLGSPTHIYYWVTSVSRSGVKSREPKSTDLGTYFSEHTTHTPTRAPRAQDIGSRILVTMYSEHDCTDLFSLYMSSDGGDSWSFLANTASETHVYNPPGDGVYYFKYRVHDVIMGDTGGYSPVSYVDYTADGTGVDDHGSLTGLEDDDHPQYAKTVDLGTAASADIGDFATTAQGSLADSAIQPADLGTAASAAITDFASAAQGSTADSAIQPGDAAGGDLAGTYPNPTLAVDRIPKSIVDAKGDLIVATADNVPARLPVGVNGLSVIARSSETTGLGYGVGTSAQGLYRDSTYYLLTKGNATQTTTTQAPGLDKIVFWGIEILEPITIDGRFMYVNTGNAGAKWRTGLYATSTSTGVPIGNTLVTDTEIDASTGGVYKTDTFAASTTLYPGFYMGALASNNATAAYRVPSYQAIDLGSVSATNVAYTSLIASWTYSSTALPDASTLTLTGTSSVAAPYVRWRVRR